jgi:hypothetical protein
MDQSKKIIMVVIILLVIAGVAFMVMNKPNKITNPATKAPVATPADQEQAKKKQALAEPSILKGEVTKVDLTSLTFKGPDGEEREYIVPSENAKFFQETEKDGAVTLVEIGLFEIELNKTVELGYDPETNEVMSVKVSK